VTADRSLGYLDLLRENRNFRNLWNAQVVSQLGDWFNTIASAAMVAKLSGSGVALGALFVTRMLPPFLLSPVAGVVADRFDRKHILIVTDVLRAAIVLGFLLVRDAGDLWWLYVLTVLQLSVSAFFFPARSAILPNVVPRQDLITANALSSSTWSAMLAIGAALGGIVTGVLGISVAFIVDSATFLFSAWFVTRMTYTREAATTSGGGRFGSFLQFVDGLRYLRGQPDTLAISLLKAGSSLATGGMMVIRVVFADRIFPLGEAGSGSLGLMYAAMGLGTGFAPVLARRLGGDSRSFLRRSIIVAFGITALGLVISARAPSLWMFLIGVLLSGSGGGINWVFSATLLQITVPDHVRGRVFAFEFAMFTLASAVASAAAGWGLDALPFDVRQMTLVGAAIALVPGTLWGLWQIRYDGSTRQRGNEVMGQ